MTVTLPEDVLERLAGIDVDLGRAVVTLVERTSRATRRRVPPVEVAAYGNSAVIVVRPVRSVRRLPGVQLVPTGDGRALISLPPDHSLPQFELDVRDALEHPRLNGVERQMLEDLHAILRRARSSGRLSAEQRTIIVLRSGRRRTSA